MPTLKLQWWLGNQMFEYALAYRISRDFDEPIVLDPIFLESRFFKASWTFRSYELSAFGIEKNYTPSPGFATRYFHPGFVSLWNRIRFWERYVHESNGILVSEFPKNSYLDGWFQSYKYFQKYDQDIKRLFQVKTPISELNQEVLDAIAKEKDAAVSIHVRRGDYVTLSEANKWHGVCSVGYYETAIAKMKECLWNPNFFVFSDDIAWCRENIPFLTGTPVYFVDHNGSAGHEDLRLMYSCSHHIIANSSFSWWGAYLGKNPEKIIIAPEKWLQTDTFTTQNLIPPSWILL